METSEKALLALSLYKEGKIDAFEAKELSGLYMADWADLCLAEGLPFEEVDLTVEDLDREVKIVMRHIRERMGVNP